MTPEGERPAGAGGADDFVAPLYARREQFLRFIRRRLTARAGARRDPEDVLQRAFAKALQRREAFQGSGWALDAWFYQLVDDVVRDDNRFHARQRRAHGAETGWPDRSSGELALGLQDPGTSPSEAAGRAETRAQIERVLRQLPADDQVLILLVNYSGLNQKEAADELGIAHDACRKRYGRALGRFVAAWHAAHGAEGAGT